MIHTFRKKFQDLKFTDDFMFGRILRSNKNLCIGILELILDIKIRDINYTEDQKSIKSSFDAKGVRLDVYAEDDEGTVYDIEMQTTDSPWIAKRSRYYQSSIDTHLIEKGSTYRELNKSYVIFICLKDPIGYGLPVYTFENRCRENCNIELRDEAYKVFINAEGSQDGLSQEMASFLNYLKTYEPSSSLTDDIDIAVHKAIAKEEWEGDFMTLEEYVKDHKDEWYAEGVAIGEARGEAIGEARGLSLGEARGLSLGEARGRAAERAELIAALIRNGAAKSDDEACRMLGLI